MTEVDRILNRLKPPLIQTAQDIATDNAISYLITELKKPLPKPPVLTKDKKI